MSYSSSGYETTERKENFSYNEVSVSLKNTLSLTINDILLVSARYGSSAAVDVRFTNVSITPETSYECFYNEYDYFSGICLDITDQALVIDIELQCLNSYGGQ
ncbi:MAG: hypothetical protein IJA22_02265 [Clostridia bacterium]|nr:hypothetical protein [Clostridia bacterium]